MNAIFWRSKRLWTGRLLGGVTAMVLSLGSSEAASHSFIKAYEGSKTCTRCHDTAALEIMKTSHWTWEHTDPKTGQKLGKKHVINNYCIAIASNEPRCTSCHVGLGYADKTFDFTDATKVDCLICHDTTGTYKKFPTGAGHPVYDTPKEFPAGSGNMWPPPDLTFIAQNVGKTRRATCGACHFFGGGGDAVKHGDLDSTMTNPKRDVDVHMGTDGGNFSCSKCHDEGEHKMSGTMYPAEITDNQRCEKCHSTVPHKSDARLNSHSARVACQTCHIPTFARGGKPTMMTWDWSKAGEKTADGKNKVVKNAQGDITYDTQKGAFTWEANVVPEYAWFNGGVTYVSLDTPVDATQRLSMNKLEGGADDPKARIFPVKRFTGVQPYDAGSQTLAIPHLFGQDADAYWKSYDWNRSLSAGMTYVARSYSGQLGYVSTEMFWIQNHMVAPKEKALRCADCHVPRGRLDFAKLGYPAERALALQTLSGFEIDAIATAPDASAISLRWKSTPGHRYQVQQSPDLAKWTDAPNGSRSSSAAPAELEWSTSRDASSGNTTFYRILRLSQ